jgi:hypothetical protein
MRLDHLQEGLAVWRGRKKEKSTLAGIVDGVCEFVKTIYL